MYLHSCSSLAWLSECLLHRGSCHCIALLLLLSSTAVSRHCPIPVCYCTDRRHLEDTLGVKTYIGSTCRPWYTDPLGSQPLTSFMISASRACVAILRRYVSLSCSACNIGVRYILDQTRSRCNSLLSSMPCKGYHQERSDKIGNTHESKFIEPIRTKSAHS